MLAGDDRTEQRGDTGVRAGVFGHLARQGRHRIGGGARRVKPSLDGFESEAHDLARGRMLPPSRSELGDARLELTLVGGAESREPMMEKRRRAHRTRAGVSSSRGRPP